MKTEKKCKGIGKALNFGCGKILPIQVYGNSNFTYSLGKSCGCFSLWLTSTNEGRKMIESATFKVNNEKQRLERKKTLQMKESLKTLAEYKKDLQSKINLIVRLIDRGYPCIATGSYEGKKNAGHYVSVASNPTIRFHLENIWLQSEHSNSWKSGDTLRYQQGIIDLYGVEYLDYLNSLQKIKPIKLTIDQVKEKIELCNPIIKWLKDYDAKFEAYQRIELRREFNKQIGIYANT